MLLNVLLGVQIVVCIVLVGVILLQRSEGGALGIGGGGGGSFMSARGAGDLLTRTTSIAAFAFFALALGLTLLSGMQNRSRSITERLDINAIDPRTMNRPQAPAAGAAGTLPAGAVTGAAPLPLQAPPPQVRGALPAPAVAPAVTAPAPRPAPAAARQAPVRAPTPAPATTGQGAPAPAAASPAPTPAPTTPDPAPAPATTTPAPATTSPPPTETPTP